MAQKRSTSEYIELSRAMIEEGKALMRPKKCNKPLNCPLFYQELRNNTIELITNTN